MTLVCKVPAPGTDRPHKVQRDLDVNAFTDLDEGPVVRLEASVATLGTNVNTHIMEAKKKDLAGKEAVARLMEASVATLATIAFTVRSGRSYVAGPHWPAPIGRPPKPPLAGPHWQARRADH